MFIMQGGLFITTSRCHNVDTSTGHEGDFTNVLAAEVNDHVSDRYKNGNGTDRHMNSSDLGYLSQLSELEVNHVRSDVANVDPASSRICGAQGQFDVRLQPNGQ